RDDFFFSSRRRHTRCYRDWSSDVCSSDLARHGSLYEGAFCLSQINQVKRNAFLLEDLFDHRLESSGALQTQFDGSVATAVLVVVEESKNPVVDLNRQIVRKFFYVVLDFLFELGINESRKSFDMFQVVNG